MKRRQVFLNAVTTLVQVIGNAGILFFLYRFLIRSIGIERLGIWSLVLATTSVVTLANQGFSTSIVKFVAKYAARRKPDDVSVLVQTAVISIGVAFAVALLALYPAAKWILRVLLPPTALPEAYAILPFALAALWINVVGGTLQAGLAGHQLITHVNYVELGSSALYLALAVWLVPRDGLLGLAYAQVAQGAACFLATWLLLKRRVPGLPFIPLRWSRRLFREAVGYGAQFQFITATQALREPVTKALLTKFGGLAITGLYDVAARWVVTFRELIVQANQVLVPTVSSLQETDPESIPTVYRESYRLIFFLAIPAFAFLVVVSPLVSMIWIGRYDAVFVRFVAVLAAGWLVNVLCNPAYVMDLGTGGLRWVSVGCAATAILNAGLGFAAGEFLDGTAVVAASVLSLIAGYAIVLVSYHLENRVPFAQLLPAESAGIILTSLFGAVIFFPFFRASQTRSIFSLTTTAGISAALLTMIVVPMWVHPMRKRLLNWVLARMPA
jgi:O-antigen/teichoic acid export membrane protein